MTLVSLLVAGTVVVSPGASQVERFAAAELASGLARVTGEAHEVVTADPGKGLRYFVGGDPLNEAPWKTDEIRLVRKGDGIILTGHPTRGALYAVNEYLERIVGVRWWTRDEADYPQLPGFRPPAALDVRYAPPFAYRETFYHGPLVDAMFKVRMKSNVTSLTRYIVPPTREAFIPPEMGGNHRLVFFKGRRSSYHSFFEVLPPEKWFATHPEWYSYHAKEGRRTTKNGQLCVTDEAMAAEYIRETLRLLRASPECDTIQVSQNDHYGPCECAKCLAFKEREGSWSGPYIAFANKVAEAIEKEFPQVAVDTFAYQFTRKAPKTVRPRHNVLVRLCDIECAFNHPLAASPASCGVNATFVEDLQAWSRVAEGRLYIWDYQADFRSYMLPHPNLHVFADNIRTFRKYGAVGVFEQGDAMCPAGDFVPLKQYVTAHLLWNPDLDADALADEFLDGYYGREPAVHLRRALKIAEKSVTRPEAEPMGCFHSNITRFISKDDALKAMGEMELAVAAAEKVGGVFPRRVRAAKMSWDHAKLLNWDRWGIVGDRKSAAKAWVDGVKALGLDAYRETTTRKTLEDYLPIVGKVDAAE